jgi:hypothetical protein
VRPLRLRMLLLFARLALALALLVTWQAALQHPIEHVDELGEFVHLHSGHSHEGESEPGPLCDALAALTACAAEIPVALGRLSSSDYEVPSHPVGAPRVAEAPPFLSQGPPVSV